ncbi:MAG: hypothetical protein A2Z38_08140 [Planctomycetes bacterium RBG_19FT_COMBO_48_8]|nr:MAG: hypothetical protein A2Z38_08140 [Planctomycetes bacterium RBG_19FT_COMBO_48_8]
MSEIEKRIESLERINRRWRYMTGLFAVLLLISLAVGAKLPDSIPEVLQARRIEVLAPDGKPGIVLIADDNRSAIGLTAQGQDHKRGISLMAHREGVELVLLKHAEAPLFLARVNDSGSTVFISDGREPSQNPRSIILTSVSPAGDSPGGTMINLMKGPRKTDIHAGLLMLEDDKGTSLLLGGDKGKSVNIRVNQEDGKVGFFGENDKVIWIMP